MKNIFMTITILLTAYSCRAQLTVYDISTEPEQVTVTKNYYYKDINNHNDTFVGTWRWEVGNSSFELVLQEFEMYSDPITSRTNIYIDKLFGKYKYIANGQTVADVQTIGTFAETTVAVCFSTPTVFTIVLRDVVSATYKVGTLTLIAPGTATMELHDSGGIKLNYGNGLPWALPTTLTLTKVE